MHANQENTKLDFAALLQPAAHYQTPNAVVNDPDLEPHEKRAILSSWASDLYAVESCPWLRDVPGLNDTLRLSDILAALRGLDEDDDDPPPSGRGRNANPQGWHAAIIAERSALGASG